MKTNIISILGCGWLGKALGSHLIKEGYIVNGSGTSSKSCMSIAENWIRPFLIDLNPAMNKEAKIGFFDCDLMIACIPPRRRDDIEEFYATQFVALINVLRMAPVSKFLFVSSTSVYGENNNNINEDIKPIPTKASGRALLYAEKLLNAEDSFKTTILRFGGLFGDDRHPGRFLAGKKDLANGNAPVNLIHQQDCVNIITRIIEEDCWGETFNAVCSKHPERQQFYSQAAKSAGLELPVFAESAENNYKIVDNSKVKKRLKYKFIYDDPMTFLKKP